MHISDAIKSEAKQLELSSISTGGGFDFILRDAKGLDGCCTQQLILQDGRTGESPTDLDAPSHVICFLDDVWNRYLEFEFLTALQGLQAMASDVFVRGVCSFVPHIGELEPDSLMELSAFLATYDAKLVDHVLGEHNAETPNHAKGTAMEQPSLYQALCDLNVDTGHHESDLYVEDTPAVRDVIARYPVALKNMTTFKDQVTGKPMLEVPFAYAPFWDKVERKLKN